MEPRNRFQGMNSASLCSLADWYYNPIPTRFLAPRDCLKITALITRCNKCVSVANMYYIDCRERWERNEDGTRENRRWCTINQVHKLYIEKTWDLPTHLWRSAVWTMDFPQWIFFLSEPVPSAHIHGSWTMLTSFFSVYKNFWSDPDPQHCLQYLCFHNISSENNV